MITATKFRMQMFDVFERVVEGESAEITWKGAKLRLTYGDGGGKLARAVRRNALLVAPEAIVESDGELMDELEKKWREDDATL